IANCDIKPRKGARYGVPALAGQTWFRTGSRNISSRLVGATSCRLKPGLHTLRRPDPAPESIRAAAASLGFPSFGGLFGFVGGIGFRAGGRDRRGAGRERDTGG